MMSRLIQLKTALAAVPAEQPCAPAALTALYTAGHTPAQYIAAAGRTDPEDPVLLGECLEQQVPGACMPVLSWLAAGLRGGLPPAATQQAHEMACTLLGVVSRVLPDDMREVIETRGAPQGHTAVVHHLDQLGTTEALCQQLARVLSALLATSFPGTVATSTTTNTATTPSSSSSSSSVPASGSTAATPPQQHASLALAWDNLRLLLYAVMDAVDMGELVPAITGSGLYQVLLEGTLLLLGAVPDAIPQAPDAQQQLWDHIAYIIQCGIFLTVELTSGIQGHLLLGAPANYQPSTGGCDESSRQPWLRPLFKLQLLLLAKMQWDARQRPGIMSTNKTPYPWTKTLTRAVPQLRSPCVAGDLLRGMAPELLPHAWNCRRSRRTLSGGVRWSVKEEILCTVPPHMVGLSLLKVYRSWLCYKDPRDLPRPDAQELGLLMELAELYCLVVPTSRDADNVWRPLLAALADETGKTGSDNHAPAAFAATCGEALISIAEYLVEDVLLVMGPDGSGAANSGSGSSSSSSSSAQRPVAGGNSTTVTMEHRMAWARDVLATLGVVLAGDYVGAAHNLLNDRTAPRLRLLLETTLRAPNILGGRLQSLLLLPRTMPALHAAASSPAGSRALLSAATTAAKRLRMTMMALVALVATEAEVAPAAAGVMAAVPGPLGHALAAAYHLGLSLAQFAQELFIRAGALLDASLGPAAPGA